MCYNPMLAVKTGKVNPETGKPQYKFLGAVKKYYTNVMQEQLEHDGKLDMLTYDGRMYVDRETGEVITRPVILACGQCLECRCQYAQQWANRIMLEAQYHDESYMLTLTYDDEHVPRMWPYEYKDFTDDPLSYYDAHGRFDATKYFSDMPYWHYYCNPRTGIVERLPCKRYRGDEVYTLEPKDLQDFVKRLRDQQHYHHSNTIRYYGVGEYGTEKHRPHYHIIVFGLHLDDVVETGTNKHGTVLHDSATIHRLWGKGITEVSPLNWEDAAYCARYTTKKLGKAETDFYKENCLVPEFTRMSLKPAIGAQYYQEHKDEIYKHDEIHLSTAKGGRTVKPPRYYDKLYDDVYPAEMAEVKGNRQEIAARAISARLNRYDGNYIELLEQRERAFKDRTKSLQRHIE